MGQRIIALACESDDLEVTAALEFPGHQKIGHDAGTIAGLGEIGVSVTEKPTEKPDVMIDFSLPDSTELWAEYCTSEKIPLVIGTTGLSQEQIKNIQTASKKIPVIVGANMSLGVNLLFKLAAEVAQKLDDNYDIEITEAHHRFKRDAPSGTAMELARQIAQTKNWPLPDCLTYGREGKETLRQKKTIGMHALRGGDIIGEHSVMFSTLGETVELKHHAHNRDTFVRGALHAAKWLANKSAGMYTMFDVLAL